MKKRKESKERQDLRLIGMRVDPNDYKQFEELSKVDPDRASAAALIRRAMRQYLERQEKEKTG